MYPRAVTTRLLQKLTTTKRRGRKKNTGNVSYVFDNSKLFEFVAPELNSFKIYAKCYMIEYIIHEILIKYKYIYINALLRIYTGWHVYNNY